jgi:hypothetical protein
MQVHALKGGLQGAKLIEHDAKRPDVALERVGAALYDLRTEIIGRPHHGFRNFHGVFQHARDAEIPQLDNVRAREEHILALYVAVEDFPIMHMLEAEAYLREPVEDLRLREIPPPLLLDHLL